MIEPVNPNPNQLNPDPNSGPVSAIVGGKEGQSVGLSEQPTTSVEENIQHGPEFAPEQSLDQQVVRAGVVSHPARPQIPKGAEEAGLTHTIPGETYAIDSSLTEPQILAETKGNPNSSGPWRALMRLKERARELFLGKKINASEAS